MVPFICNQKKSWEVIKVASRIIHLVISKKVSQNFDFDALKFSVGNLLPDCHERNNEAKYMSHFRIRNSQFNSKRLLDYKEFANKYSNYIKDEVYLGYFSHLISDEIWLKGIYSKYMLDENYCIKEENRGTYYKDYGRLNSYLIHKFQLKNDIKQIDPVTINEIDHSKISDLLIGLDSDFDKNESTTCELKLFSESDILNYIEEAADCVTDKIKKVL
ncbi:hypothetical protein [Vallitalea okinawensis]|uniref:hypothetical protein n=1 Tax=Vallitalea okinawensis TaxID=2078660 RepID=UPI000CFDF60B|nr:hypothetical protein [Vallitalea okinawensis]